MTQIVGNYLNDNEKQTLLTSIGNQKEFHELIAAMKQHTEVDFKEDSLTLEKGLKFDLADGESVVSVKSIELLFDKNIKIHYIERVENGNVDDTKNIVIGRIINEAGHKVFNESDGEINVEEVPFVDEAVAYDAVQENEFFDGFILDENYVPGQLLEQVSEKDLFPTDGCLPGGYIYCGGKCGGHPACASTKAGVNKLDTNCCKNHDCCWKHNPSDDGKKACDAIFCNCASYYVGEYLGAIAVVAKFCKK